MNMSSVVTKRWEHMLAYRKTIQYKCKKCSQIHTRHHFIWAKPERA